MSDSPTSNLESWDCNCVGTDTPARSRHNCSTRVVPKADYDRLSAELEDYKAAVPQGTESYHRYMAENARLRAALDLAHQHMQIWIAHYGPGQNIYESTVKAMGLRPADETKSPLPAPLKKACDLLVQAMPDQDQLDATGCNLWIDECDALFAQLGYGQPGMVKEPTVKAGESHG